MNISKEVLELDFDKIYNKLELESKEGYNKYIKYMQLPKCITSFVMYCCDVVSNYYKPFNIEDEIYLNNNGNIKITDWTLYYKVANKVCVDTKNLIKFNNQIPE